MQRIHSSVAFPIFLTLLLLSILTLAGTFLFSRPLLARHLLQQTTVQCRQQAGLQALLLSQVADEQAARDFVLSNQPQVGIHSLVDMDGTYLVHPEPLREGQNLREIFAPAVVDSILSGQAGQVVDPFTNTVVIYSVVEGRDWVDIISIKQAAIESQAADLVKGISSRLGIGLLLMVVAGGGMAWLIIDAPLNRLTEFAQGIGQPGAAIQPGRMPYQLRILAEALEHSQEEIKRLFEKQEARGAELKQAYESLQASEHRFRTLFDSANDAILVLGLEDGSILDVNSKFEELFGHNRQEAHRLRIVDISVGKHPYNQRSALQWVRRTRQHGPQVFE